MKAAKKIKGTIFLLMLSACFMLSTSSTTTLTRKNSTQVAGGYIYVCHSGQNLKVPTTEVEFHLRHGDLLGGCLADTH